MIMGFGSKDKICIVQAGCVEKSKFNFADTWLNPLWSRHICLDGFYILRLLFGAWNCKNSRSANIATLQYGNWGVHVETSVE